MNKFALVAIRAYQFFLSPMLAALGARCRFHPSCSNYAMDAFRELPWQRAVFYSARRLAKCGPWHQGGIDEVKL